MSDTQDSLTSSIPSTRVQGQRLTPKQRKEKQTIFLETYRKHGVVKHACEAAGIDRMTFYYWRDNDEAFNALFSYAKEDAIDTLEHAAYQQAVEGTQEPVVSMGRVVYGSDGEPLTVTKYSPQLLITLLKANRPDKYKEKSQVEHTGKDGGPIEVSAVRERIVQKITAMKQGMAFKIDEVP